MIIGLSKIQLKFRRFILLLQIKKGISMNYGSSTSCWKLKTMEKSEVWPDTYDEGYINQFQTEPTHKIHEQQQKHQA